MAEATGARRNAAVSDRPATLGKLTIVDTIGEGGMARIFLARTRGIGGFEKEVVVKQILPGLAEDAEFIARFFQEARLAATLDHPNIAVVYDVDEVDGAYFYSMEYVRGRDLQKVARRAAARGRVLSLSEIVTIVTGLCAGLHHAHSRADAHGRPLGIVHRDVSPSNVLLSFEGAIKLADFGVAKARTGMVSTAAGTLRGKIPYMSPEQCEGEGLDRRSDVYAVGALTWELVTGQRLHSGDSEVAMLRRIAEQDAPSPRTLRPDCPPALEAIVAKALARRPAERYGSAEDLRADLEEFARVHKVAVSSRVIAELMRELFGADERARTEAMRSPRTVAVGAPGARRPAGDATPPTGTLAPIAAAAAGPGPALEVDPDPSSAAIVLPRERRRYGALAVGVVIGAVLGGGGLYLALARAPATAAPPPDAAAEGAVAGTATVPTPTPATAPAPEASAEPEPAAGTEPAPEPDPQAGVSGDEPSPASTHDDAERAAAEPPPAAARGRAGRRKTKRRSGAGNKRAIDLDSALPPGFDGG